MALTTGSMLSNAGAPQSGDGANGDHYRNTTNQDLWFKTGGAWALVGNTNDDTPDGIGTTILTGSGNPINGNGNNGNYYRDTATQNLWYKNAGTWALIGTLVPGLAEGAMIVRTGAGVPSNGLGYDGEHYRDTVNQDIYFKTAGTWAVIGTWAV